MKVGSFNDHINIKDNGRKLRFGQEAILKFGQYNFNKKSLNELIRRGNRNCNCAEINHSLENSERLKSFIKHTAHGREPQLKGFFDTEFLEKHRMFIIQNEHNKWYGAILITVKDSRYVQSELLLHRRFSPAGVMEALIYYIYNKLDEEGFELWSLGAVPFIGNFSPKFLKEFLIVKFGRLFNFAYNYKGLYNFKNKFNPEWIDCYLLSNKKITYSSILKLFMQSNFLTLIVFKLVLSIQNFLS